MNGDVRRPRVKKTDEEENKQINTDTNLGADSLEAPHLYSQEEGFAAANASQKTKKKSRFSHLVFFKHATKKQQMIGGALAAVLIVGGGTGVYALSKADKPTSNVATPVVQKTVDAPKPTTEASKLTGEQISPELNKRPVTGIMIENSPDARPQAGLKDAGIVYEAVAEGGITRFLTLFQESQPDYIGPVRSVRPYYVDLLLPYDASITHAGGSADGLNRVKSMGVKDIDHGANGGAFKRVNDRYAPHNLYTSMADLDKVSASRGFTTSNVKSLARKKEQAGQAITAKAIDISISSALYNVHYDYDAASNTYKRSEGGKPHNDHRSGQQLAPKVVVTMAMNYSQKGIYSVYQTTGSGSVKIYQDGIVQQGTWSRASERDQFTFADEAGKPIALNAGQTWITLVKAANAVSHTP